MKRHFLTQVRYLALFSIILATLGVYRLPPAVSFSDSAPAPRLVLGQGLRDTTIQLLWHAVEGASLYEIYRDGQLVAVQAGTLFLDTPLEPSTTYRYQVAARVDERLSPFSDDVVVSTQAAQDTSPPSRPGTITIGSLTSSSAELSWSGSSDNVRVMGYRMLRGKPGDPLANMVQIATTEGKRHYTATRLLADTEYQFAVIAIDAGNNISTERLVTFRTTPSEDATPPVPVSSSSVTATPFSSTRIDILWGASTSTDVSGYQIFRNGLLVGEVYLPLRRYFSDNDLSPNTSYTYQVRAVDSAGNVSELTAGRSAKTTAPGEVKIVRGPYIQTTGQDFVQIAWWTNIPAPSQVFYGLDDLGHVVSDPVLKHQHVMLISGLAAGSRYQYRVVSGAAQSSQLSFPTAAPPGRPFSFAVVADFGGGGPETKRVAGNIAAGGTDFVQTLGDNIYPDAEDPDFTRIYYDLDARFYRPYATVMSSQTFWLAGGNHEYYGNEAFWRNIWMPNNERWYSYDWGDAHILVLDSEQPYHPGSVQYQFAENDLIASQGRPWRIVVVHNPPYSSTTVNSSATKVRADLVPLFERYGVQLVLSGSSHNYERTYPLLSNIPQGSGGIIYLVSGGGGNGLNQFVMEQPEWSAFRQAIYQHARISVSRERLLVEAVRADTAEVFDSVVILASPEEATPLPAETQTSTPEPAPTDTPFSTETPLPEESPTPAPTLAPTDTPTPEPVLPPTATDAIEPTETSPPIPSPTDTPESTPEPTTAPMPTSSATADLRQYVFSDGFETGSLAAWNSSVGLVVQNQWAYRGAFAAQADTTNGNTFAKKNLPSTYSDGYARIYFNLLSYSHQVNLLRFRTAGDASLAYLFVSTKGKLGLRNDITATTYTSQTSVGSGWQLLEFRAVINGSDSYTEVWLNGERINDLSFSAPLGTTGIGRLQIGEVFSSRTYNVIFDEVAFDTLPIGP